MDWIAFSTPASTPSTLQFLHHIHAPIHTMHKTAPWEQFME